MIIVDLPRLLVAEGMDSSATDSGTEDVLSPQPPGLLPRKYQDHSVSRDEHQPRQYKTKKLDSDGDWLANRSGNDWRSGRQHKVIFDSICCSCQQFNPSRQACISLISLLDTECYTILQDPCSRFKFTSSIEMLNAWNEISHPSSCFLNTQYSFCNLLKLKNCITNCLYRL